MRPSRGDLVFILRGLSAAARLTVAGGFGLPELSFFGVMNVVRHGVGGVK